MNPLPVLKALPWKWIGVGILAVACVILLALWKGEQRHSGKLETQIGILTELRVQDRRNIEAASKAATLQNQQQVARIEANAAAITEKAKDDFEADRAHLRTELANRLRTETKANSGRSYADRAGLVPNASGKPDGQAVSLPADELLLAAETELQLKALQDWIEVQAKVQR